MSQIFPSAQWSDGLKQAINGDQRFLYKGKSWTDGALALVIEAEPAAGLDREMAILLDLDSGVCRDALYLDAEQARERARFVIEAGYDLWREILEGKLDPTKALMQWKLRVTKGALPTIIKHAPAIKEVMLSAARVPARFGK